MTSNLTVLFDKYGTSEVLYLKNLPKPIPKDNEVRIKVKVIGVGRVECLFFSGVTSPAIFPSSLGFEASGIIDAIGDGVKDFKIGDSVSVLSNTLFEGYTTNAQYIIQPIHSIIKNDSAGISHEQAASIWFSYLTAYFAFVKVCKIKKGDWVLITGASSSTGLGAIQLAKIFGANVIASSRSDEKREGLLSYGADDFVNINDENFIEKVNKITNGTGVNIVYDAIGGPVVSEKFVKVLAVRGTIILYAYIDKRPTVFPIQELFMKYANVKAYLIYEFSSDPVQLKEATDFLCSHLLKGEFPLIIGERFRGMQGVLDAYKYLEKNDLFGKIIIDLQE